MTDEEIPKLAERYADKECAMSKHTGKKLQQLHEYKIVEFYDVFGFLIEKFCMASRDEIKMRYASSVALAEYDPAHREFYRGQSSMLESIFGKDMFEEEKE